MQYGRRFWTDGDWYLRSSLDDSLTPSIPSAPSTPAAPPTPSAPLYQPGVPVYESYANILQSFNTLGTLQQRVGNRSWAAAPGRASNVGTLANGTIEGNGVWARMEASHGSFDPKESTSRANYDLDTWRLQVGVDKLLHEAPEGSLIAGLSANYGTVSAGIDSIYGNGKISTTGYGLGAATTWYGNSGFYVDGQAQATWYDSDLSSRMAGVGTLARGNNAFGYGLSLEAGQRIALDAKWSVTPQAQLAYSSVDFDRFIDPFGAQISLDRSNNLTGRLGVTLNYQNETHDAGGVIDRSNVYGIANVYYDFMDGARTDVAGTTFINKNEPLWAGVGVGGSYNWSRDKYSLYGETSVKTSMANFGDSYAMTAMVGLRVRW
ncbi:MAG TPA: autotransporter outer membrane beta-barrel domain-containing protein [Eoetvoesiella sp.]